MMVGRVTTGRQNAIIKASARFGELISRLAKSSFDSTLTLPFPSKCRLGVESSTSNLLTFSHSEEILIMLDGSYSSPLTTALYVSFSLSAIVHQACAFTLLKKSLFFIPSLYSESGDSTAPPALNGVYLVYALSAPPIVTGKQ